MPDASTFQRVEKKYRLGAAQRHALEGMLARSMEPDAFAGATVSSLYLDTPGRELIARSLDKPLYKEKLRLRAYGDEAGRLLARCFHADGSRLSASEAATEVFLEAKAKVDGVGVKRRIALSLGAARLLLAGVSLAQALDAHPLPAGPLSGARQRQIACELEAFLTRHPGLEPSMAIRCQRTAWRLSSPSRAFLRITFDARLEYLDLLSPLSDPGALGCPAEGPWEPLLAADDSILEVKCGGAYPLWLVDLLACQRIYPTSFSKYGAAAQRTCA